MERNETAPSELVKRLTALAQEQILDSNPNPNPDPKPNPNPNPNPNPSRICVTSPCTASSSLGVITR